MLTEAKYMEAKSPDMLSMEFSHIFNENLSNKLAKFETERQRALLLAVLSTISGLVCFLGALYFVITHPTVSESLSKLEGLVLSCLFFFTISIGFIIKKCFEEQIKIEIRQDVCKSFGNLKWKIGRYDEEDIFHIANLFEHYKASFDDVFYGRYGDVDYEIIESELFRDTKGKLYKTIFKGCIVRMRMNKKFIGNTVIYPNSIMHKSPFKELRYTELEDTIFEKKFDVFTDDEVEARYLITPTFMERLYNMKLAFNAKKIYCSFYDTDLFIGLYTEKDLFSLGSLFRPTNDPKQFFQMFEQILSIRNLISYFKLEQKTGL